MTRGSAQTAQVTSATAADISVPSTLHVLVRTLCVVGIEPDTTHGVDLDTVIDEHGVPFVPRYRMAARLRDAALIVLNGPDARPGSDAGPDSGLDSGAGAGAAADPHSGADTATGMSTVATDLFGSSATAASSRRMLQVGAAVWPQRARATVARAMRDRPSAEARALLRERVTDALTVRTAQTAIGSDGAPLTGSLRFFRGIRPGVELAAELRWTRPPSHEHVRFLARCVLALDQIGAHRSDGMGRVSCSLDGDFARTRALAYPDVYADE